MTPNDIHAQSRKQKDARKAVQRILQPYFAALLEESRAKAETLLERAIRLCEQGHSGGEGPITPEPMPATR